jgi:hypothetical protein
MPERLIELARAADRLDDPGRGLEAVSALRQRLQALEASHVENAVRAGWSWSRIAGTLGVTRQAAHKKHAPRLRAKQSREPVPPVERAKLVVTGQARRSVRLARREADLLGQRYLGTEHLLLGLLSDDDGPAVRALGSLGVTLADARAEVLRQQEGTEGGRTVGVSSASGRFPISTSAREAMEQSLREAVRLESAHLGVEHVLLALVRVETGAASRVLASLGVTGPALEQRLSEVLAEEPQVFA